MLNSHSSSLCSISIFLSLISLILSPTLSSLFSMLVSHSFYYFLQKQERNINLLFHPPMHSQVDFCLCPDQGSNLKPWHIGSLFQSTELSRQRSFLISFNELFISTIYIFFVLFSVSVSLINYLFCSLILFLSSLNCLSEFSCFLLIFFRISVLNSPSFKSHIYMFLSLFSRYYSFSF